MKKGAIFLIIFDIFIAGCFFITYGPISDFRDTVITAAMTSKDHKYIARTFYSEDTINAVLAANTTNQKNSKSDTSEVKVGDNDYANANKYEKKILKHKKGEVYKTIKFKYNGYQCYLTAVYDPSRVSLMQTNNLGVYGQVLSEMAKDNGALIAINGGGFSDPNGRGNGGTPEAVVIKDGVVTYGDAYSSFPIAGFTNDNILYLTNSSANQAIKEGMRDAVVFSPFLIVNGEEAQINGNGGWGTNPRTVLAQRKDGIVLFLVIDGNGQNNYNFSGRGGATMEDLIVILKRYGAFNAVNMDGGASTDLVENGIVINNPCALTQSGERALPNGWMVK